MLFTWYDSGILVSMWTCWEMYRSCNFSIRTLRRPFVGKLYFEVWEAPTCISCNGLCSASLWALRHPPAAPPSCANVSRLLHTPAECKHTMEGEKQPLCLCLTETCHSRQREAWVVVPLGDAEGAKSHLVRHYHLLYLHGVKKTDQEKDSPLWNPSVELRRLWGGVRL